MVERVLVSDKRMEVGMRMRMRIVGRSRYAPQEGYF